MSANGGDDKALTPQFKQSSYVNESVTLENPYITMNFFKRIKGWGWGEIHTPEGKLMAVMDHLGELMIRDQDIPMRFNNDYLETIVLCDKVVDGAHHLLEHLHKRGPVYVLSNGFENLQYRKLRSGKLDKYIDRLILSDDINVTKPDRRLFDYALDAVGGEASTTVMIGDNYDADILGAKNAGWQTIFFDRTGSVANPEAADLTVVSLKEIERYL